MEKVLPSFEALGVCAPPAVDEFLTAGFSIRPPASPASSMNHFENLLNAASQLTVYDVQKAYTTAKNVILNVPEFEAKVNEATNDDPWGASTTLMLDIANATHN